MMRLHDVVKRELSGQFAKSHFANRSGLCFCFLILFASYWEYFKLLILFQHLSGLPGGAVKNPPVNAGDPRDMGSSPKSRRSLEVGHGNLLQCACLENSVDRRAWQGTVCGVAKSQTRLSDLAYTHVHTHTHTRTYTLTYSPYPALASTSSLVPVLVVLFVNGESFLLCLLVSLFLWIYVLPLPSILYLP